MNRTTLSPDQLTVSPHSLWNDQWMLLSAGAYGKEGFNCMTVAWGSLGTMWRRPFAQIVVRPTRHTFEYTEAFDTFTLCAFPESYRDDLLLLGSKSGRKCDKLAETSLTPMAATTVAAPAYKEAELVIECRKIYWQDMNPEQFLDPAIRDLYAGDDFHRIYYGEILAVQQATPPQ